MKPVPFTVSKLARIEVAFNEAIFDETPRSARNMKLVHHEGINYLIDEAFYDDAVREFYIHHSPLRLMAMANFACVLYPEDTLLLLKNRRTLEWAQERLGLEGFAVTDNKS